MEALSRFCANTGQCLELEVEEERKELDKLKEEFELPILQECGIAMRKLLVEKVSTGIGGRPLVSFHKPPLNQLPASQISRGDVVGIFEGPDVKGTPIQRGVVHFKSRSLLVFAPDVSEDPIVESSVKAFNVVLMSNDATYRRLRECLKRLEQPLPSVQSALKFAFEETPSPPVTHVVEELQSTLLNDSQLASINHAIRTGPIACIHGPPGTGKTTALAHLIVHQVRQGRRLLVSAPSNVAVDTLLERVGLLGLTSMVRFGHPSRVRPETLKFALDSVLLKTDAAQLAADVRSELAAALAKRKKVRSKQDRAELRAVISELRKELRSREKGVLRALLETVDVVFCTCVGAGDPHLVRFAEERPFDLVIVDEAAQALEVACWVPMMLGKRTILAGDHHQLAPTVKSKKAGKQGLGVTLFHRILVKNPHGSEVSRMLSVQYRMHRVINDWASDQFYGGELHPDNSVADRTLSGPDRPFVWIDTLGLMAEDDTPVDPSSPLQQLSKSNEGEARAVVGYITHELAAVDPRNICVITPYNAQVALIRDLLGERVIRVASVDSFQGQEADVIIISLVRSNCDTEVGFLGDARRLNVAVTRAKLRVVLIGDYLTLSSDPILDSIYCHAEAYGTVRCIMDVPGVGEGSTVNHKDPSKAKQSRRKRK
ncbi:MAG: uncharacterized protein KVP18_000028 [Porospora cf. gigantea A]|uniref:uncharacterized protein n=1 Tax=Porospora cf. gigantea A TaxID=2853593 RepID=UPI00355A8727|nr:MAG: hypothetical protein KVP18_000028 [Porospora cf. gigantea A]